MTNTPKILGVIPARFNSTRLPGKALREIAGMNIPERGAVAFQFDVPLTQLKPGTYVCQVNVIDDAGGSYSFPRMALRVQTPAAPVAAPLAIPAVVTAPKTGK